MRCPPLYLAIAGHEAVGKSIGGWEPVVDGAALMRIALARGPGGLSLCQTAAWSSMLGIAELSNPGGQIPAEPSDGLSCGPGGTATFGESARRGPALARPQLAPRRRHLCQQTRQERLGSVRTGDVRHGPDSNASCTEPESISV